MKATEANLHERCVFLAKLFVYLESEQILKKLSRHKAVNKISWSSIFCGIE